MYRRVCYTAKSADRRGVCFERRNCIIFPSNEERTETVDSCAFLSDFVLLFFLLFLGVCVRYVSRTMNQAESRAKRKYYNNCGAAHECDVLIRCALYIFEREFRRTFCFAKLAEKRLLIRNAFCYHIILSR